MVLDVLTLPSPKEGIVTKHKCTIALFTNFEDSLFLLIK